VVFCVWPLSLNDIHAVACISILFFFLLPNDIPLDGYTTFYLLHPTLMDFFFFFFFIFLLLFICAYKAWFISPPCPRPLPYHPLRPLPLPLFFICNFINLSLRDIWKLSMVVHAYNLSTGRLKQEDHKFEANLGYIARSCLNKTKETFGDSWKLWYRLDIRWY
jgi:hypothetical protein